jgi:glycolate oxidase FAD binding subunit
MSKSSVKAPERLGDALAAVPDLALAGHPATAGFLVDRRAPDWVARPTTVAALTAAVATAAEAGAHVVPWGAGTQPDLGAPLTAFELALVTHGLAGVTDHQPADLTVTCGAGTTLAELEAALAPAGQFLPLDPPGGGLRTAGGVVSARASGPRRVARGHPRELVLGMQVVLASGATVRTGGRVVKNVAGYDLSKLMTGALGTLGVITELTFRVYPRPPMERTYVARFSGAEAAVAAAAEVRRRAIPLTALLVADGAASARLGLDHGVHLVVRLDGAEAALARRTELVAAAAPGLEALAEVEAERLWTAVASFPLRAAGEAALITRTGVPPAGMPALPPILSAAGAGTGAAPATLYDAGMGLLHTRWELPQVEGLVLVEAAAGPLAALRAALGTDGYAIVEACPPDLKPALDLWGRRGADWTLMRRVKARLDPAELFAPGRMA